MPRSVQAMTSTPPGDGAAGNAAVRQVEAAAGQVEKDEIALGALGQQCCRRQSGQSADEAGLEHRAAVGIGDGFAQDLVVAGKQGERRHCIQRLGRIQRAQEHRQPVLAREGAHADIGDDEPLRGARFPVLALVAQRNRAQHIDPGLALGQQAVDRNAGGDLAVGLDGDVDRALPDRRAEILGDRIDRIAIELPEEVGAGDDLRQGALADTIQFQISRGR
jgi:hypothetical protein